MKFPSFVLASINIILVHCLLINLYEIKRQNKWGDKATYEEQQKKNSLSTLCQRKRI